MTAAKLLFDRWTLESTAKNKETEGRVAQKKREPHVRTNFVPSFGEIVCFSLSVSDQGPLV